MWGIKIFMKIYNWVLAKQLPSHRHHGQLSLLIYWKSYEHCFHSLSSIHHTLDKVRKRNLLWCYYKSQKLVYFLILAVFPHNAQVVTDLRAVKESQWQFILDTGLPWRERPVDMHNVHVQTTRKMLASLLDQLRTLLMGNGHALWDRGIFIYLPSRLNLIGVNLLKNVKCLSFLT